jgi:3-hydroxyisobutyrate dehydrogenase
MTANAASTIGFVGLGAMGEPMALNITKAGYRLVVWNRTPAKAKPLKDAGAEVATSAEEVLARAETTILMLRDGAAIDAVLRRQGADFADRVRGKTIVNMGTTSPAFSRQLETDLNAAGACYVEAPVSGSRAPAQAGQLVAMLAGEATIAERIRPLVKPMCREAIYCGPVPSALLMKLSVNVFLLPLVTALAESMHFAERHGLSLEQLVGILDAGPMASVVSRTKAAKLASREFAVQASVANAFENCRLTAEAAKQAGVSSPLIDVCHALYGETLELGLADLDMVAVLRAFEQRTLALPQLDVRPG